MNQDLILLALKLLKCNQKQLAEKLNVSPTQITKWKKGEHMSWEMRDNIIDLLDIEDLDPTFVLMSGSISDAKKWRELIHFLADMANESAETGYDTLMLTEERDMLDWRTFHTLKDMGVEIPPKFPKELEVINQNSDEDYYEIIDNNPYSKLIYEIYLSLNDVYGFYIAYIYNILWHDDLNLYDTDACNIEPCLMDLSASKLDVDANYLSISKNFKSFRYQTIKNFEKWLTIVKETAIHHNVPLKAEILDLVYEDSNQLGYDAERESLGFNKGNLHPDIYMNELLTGMRIIHQVLPAILKKLDIYDEFYLDDGSLRLKK